MFESIHSGFPPGSRLGAAAFTFILLAAALLWLWIGLARFALTRPSPDARA